MAKSKAAYKKIYPGKNIQGFFGMLSSAAQVFLWVFTVIFFAMAIMGLILNINEKGIPVFWSLLVAIPLGLIVAWLVFADLRDTFLDWILPLKIDRGAISKKEEDLDTGVEGLLTHVYSVFIGDKEYFVNETIWKKLARGQFIKLYYTARRKIVKRIYLAQ